MKIYFVCADDKVFMPNFFKNIFSNSEFDCQGVAIVRDPNFRKFLLKSIKFMGLKLFLAEIFYQVKLRMKNFILRIFKSSCLNTIESICSRHDIECNRVDKINTRKFRETLRGKEIDVLISMSCPQILKKRILATPNLAAINVHYALLPEYRGLYPSFWVLANGESKTGVTIHHMVREVDAGKIIVQAEEKIRDDDTFYSLVGRLKSSVGPKALMEALSKISREDNSFMENNIENGSYYSFPERYDMEKFLANGKKWR